MTEMDYKYTLLSSDSEDCQKRPFLFHVDNNNQMNLFAVLEVRRDNYRRWGGLPCFRKAKVYSIGLGLTVMSLVMASYILTGEKKGLLITPSPYQYSTVNNSGLLNSHVTDLSFLFNLSSVRDYTNMKLVVKTITSNIEFSTRQLPDLKDLVKYEQHMFSIIPSTFLPNVKNPCWYEEYTGNITADPYGTNLYALYSKRFRTVFDYLRNAFREHLYRQGNKYYRFRCLPYFYIIGQPKCGTTDLYDRLRLHPDVRFTTFKEPHWWTRKRFGEASASTLWDNNAWVYFYENATAEGEPPFLIQDFIHAVQPNAKFIIMLRDPVERLYSDYLYFGIANKSADDFHEKVSESLQLFESCILEYSMKSCVYNTTLNNAMPVRLQVGLYIVYILDWLTVFDRNQMLVLRLEDHATNRKYTMHKVFDFLSLGPLTEQKEAEITKSPASNTRRQADKNLGPMLPATREILKDFYTPFNARLAQEFKNDSFLWEKKSKFM
ncbi:carbohydrate sulfotransferase 15-like isoform X2 [Polyodon spathula]|uniref:carbohydrate sulfotransferase 15-like isoform X2 n=1 Tax=Polyodon spathula TaxID=7913 RepID=UPI001B7E866E|nr:carbohydrate sulfotransferase 15-like isoform X2 [Polyodon spathula]